MTTYLKELFKSQFFWCSTTGLFVCLIMSVAFTQTNEIKVSVLEYLFTFDKSNFTGSTDAHSLISHTNSTVLSIIYPIISGFAIAPLFCDKNNCGFSRFAVIRTGKYRLSLYQLLTTVIATFATTFIAFTLYTVTVTIAFPTVVGGLFEAFLLKLLLLFVVMLIGSLLCLLCASLISNQYFALFTPMFLCYIISGLCDRAVVAMSYTFGWGQETYMMTMINPYNILSLNAYIGEMPDWFAYSMPIIIVVSLLVITFFTVSAKGGRQR